MPGLAGFGRIVEIGPTTDLASTGSCNECCGTSGRHSHLFRFRTERSRQRTAATARAACGPPNRRCIRTYRRGATGYCSPDCEARLTDHTRAQRRKVVLQFRRLGPVHRDRRARDVASQNHQAGDRSRNDGRQPHWSDKEPGEESLCERSRSGHLPPIPEVSLHRNKRCEGPFATDASGASITPRSEEVSKWTLPR